MLLALIATVLADTAAPPPPEHALLRVCVESVDHRADLRWSISKRWPFLSVWTEVTATALVRPLETREPSWMWDRPLWPAPVEESFPLAISLDEGHRWPGPGEVLYLDAAAVAPQLAAAAAAPPHVAQDQAIHRVLSQLGGQYEVERCRLDAIAAR